MELLFCTGNAQKFNKGMSICRQHDITLIQRDLNVDEVQSEDTEYVARQKANASYAVAQRPIVISDDAWEIPGLNGFPGTYAKSVNTWFKPEDYVQLTKDLEDRRIYLVQTLVYQDENTQKIFVRKSQGKLLTKPQGSVGVSIQKVVSFDNDGGKSISEIMEGKTHYSGEQTIKVWHDFADWYKEHAS